MHQITFFQENFLEDHSRVLRGCGMNDAAKPWDVFIGWSKHGRDALSSPASKLVYHFLDIFFAEDLNLFHSEEQPEGNQWLPKIEQALPEVRAGIFCFTDKNQPARWLCFEAGAVFPKPASRRPGDQPKKPQPARQLYVLLCGSAASSLPSDHPLHSTGTIDPGEEKPMKKMAQRE